MTLGAYQQNMMPWGEQLRAWRKDVKHWSQDELREQMEAASYRLKEQRGHQLTVRHIRKWEAGEVKKPQPVYLRILESMGAPSPTAPRAHPHPPLISHDDWIWSTGTAAELISQATQKDLSMNRRDLGRLFVGLSAGGPLLEHIERLLSSPVPTPHLNHGASIDTEEVAQIENAARLFREWDDQFGGGLRRKAVIGQLNEISDLLSDPHPPEIVRRLNGVMAQLAETAAMMSWDSGHGVVAQRYYIMALHASKAAGDRPFAANVLAGMARQSLYLGNANDALELVRMAQTTIEGHAQASVESMLYTREAWAYAALGRITAFQRAAQMAEDSYVKTQRTNDPHWIQYFDLAELHGTIGGRLLELAASDRTYAESASERISMAIAARRPNRLRSSALDELGLAESYILRGELDEGARLGHIAIETVSQTSSDRVQVQLAGLLHRTEPHARIISIADLRDHMGATIAASRRVRG